MLSLSEAISAYQTALGKMSTPPSEGSSLSVMSVLLTRDALAQALTSSDPVTAEVLLRVTELDRDLQSRAAALAVQAGAGALAGWRDSVQPPASSWWWYIDERAAESESSPHLLWMVISGFFLALALSLTAEISRRFLSVGSDFIGVFSTISQGALALLAGSTLTNMGHEEVERLLGRFSVPRRHHHFWKAGLSLLVFLLVLSLRFSLPSIARYYNDLGVHQQNGGLVTSAIDNFRRSISLNPDFAQAHYNLATAFEDVLDYDRALAEYQTALQAAPGLYLTYNNLARLYILRRNDPASALKLLNVALELNPSSPMPAAAQYSLYKNRGWANLALKLYGQADADLRQALELRPDGAAAHCFLAQLLEAKGNLPDALPEWESCLRYEKGDVVEASWAGLARERLNQEGSKPQ
jgi:tetratricopeptide (TPR) repeat protein